MATGGFSADNQIANEEIDNEKCSTQETPVPKKRRVLKRVLKKKKQDTSLIEACKKKKKVYNALSNSINLSMSMQKQTLLANNRALAYKLEQTRQERRLLNEAIIELRREHESLWMKNTKLEAVVGIKNEEIELEVDRRLSEHLFHLKTKLGKVGKFLLDGATLLKESMDDISVNIRRSAGSSRASSLGRMSEWLTTDLDQGCKRSLNDNFPETELPDVDGMVGHDMAGPVMPSLSHDMSVIAEQSILLENITPPPEMVDGSPIQEEIDADDEKSKSSSTDITKATFINAKPRRILCKPAVKDDLNFNLEDLIGQEGKTEKESSEKDHLEREAIEDHGKGLIDNARSKRSDRRGTFVVSPKNITKQPNSTQSVVTDSTNSVLSQSSGSLEELQPPDIVKKSCPENSVNKELEKPFTTVCSSDSDRRKTFVIPSKSSENIRNDKMTSLAADDEVTIYFNTDMEFTEVLDRNQLPIIFDQDKLICDKDELISSESFKSKFMTDDSNSSSKGTEANTETVKKDVLTRPAEVGNRSKQRQKKGDLPTKEAVKSSASDSSSKSNSDNNKVINSTENESVSHVKPSFEFRLPKPGIFRFSATRKEIDGTRKPVPSKLPTKSRSKSKVKLTRKESNDQDEYKSPKPIKSIFDFHDKTPRIIAEHGSQAVASVYDLSMNESSDSFVGDYGNKATTSHSSNTSKTRQEISQKSKWTEKDSQNLAGDDNVKMDSKTKSRTKTKRTNDSDEPKGDEFSHAASAVSGNTQSKESQNKLLGDKSVYYLPLKDSSPEVNVKKGRSRSQSRSKSRSRKCDANSDTDQEIDQKSRSRSRSRRRKGDSGNGDDAVSKRLSTKSKNMAESSDSNQEELSEAKSAASSTKETQNKMLGDEPIYYLPLKDSSPEVNVRKGRTRSKSRSKGRKSEKSDVESDTDLEVVLKSRSRSRSRRRKVDSDTGNGDDDVSKRLSTKSQNVAAPSDSNEEKQEKLSEAKSAASSTKETQNKMLGDEPIYYLPLKDSSPEVNVRKGRTRSKSRSKGRKSEKSDVESDTDLEVVLKSRSRSRSRRRQAETKTGNDDDARRNSRGRSRTRRVEESEKRCTRSKSRAREEMQTDELLNDESEEEKIWVQESPFNKSQQRSRGRSRSRASTKETQLVDHAHVQENRKPEESDEPGDIETSPKLLSRSSKKSIVLSKGQEDEVKSTDSMVSKENITPGNDIIEAREKEKTGKKQETTSRCHSRSHTSTKIIVNDVEESEEKETHLQEQKSDGRLHNRASMKRVVCNEDSYEENSIDREISNKNNDINQMSRNQSRSCASSKQLFIDNSDEDTNGDKKQENKNLMLNRKSRDRLHSRASAEPFVVASSDDDDDDENDDEKVKGKKRDETSRGRPMRCASKRKYVFDTDSEEEKQKNEDNIVLESPVDNVKRKSKSCLTSSKKLNKNFGEGEKENAKDQTEFMPDSSKKSHPQVSVVGSAEIKNKNTGNEVNIQNLRKRLAALENNQRSMSLEYQDKKGDEPDCKRSRRGGVVSYKEPPINKKMRQPASGSSPSQSSRSKKHAKKLNRQMSNEDG